jgi:hypothetical protein
MIIIAETCYDRNNLNVNPGSVASAPGAGQRRVIPVTASDHTTLLKRCTKCGLEFPATTEFFWNSKTSHDGLQWRCKKCKYADKVAHRRKRPDLERTYKKRKQDKRRAEGRCLSCGRTHDNAPKQLCNACRNKAYPRLRELDHKRSPYRTHRTPCVFCGFEYSDVHHIDGDHTNNNPANLISLCPNHHRLVHWGLLVLLPNERIGDSAISDPIAQRG